MAPPLLLIGLGNPGKDYAANRHNIGFMAIDALHEKYGTKPQGKKFSGIVSEADIDGAKVLLFKPMTYMNLSGEPALQLAQFFKIPLSNITVFHDELDLPLAKVRVKRGGGAGGHNGLKSLDANIGQDYRRVRLGIGHPGDKDMVSDYVLADFAKPEKPAVEKLLDDVVKHVALLLKGDDAGFMNKLSPSEPKAKKEEK